MTDHQTDAFSAYNPLLNFVFFIGAVVLTMWISHPVFLICGVILSGAYLFSIKGTRAFGTMGALLILFIAVALINPLFSTGGNTVLFTYFGGRPYTFEALCYGMCTGAMVYTVMLWFATYNAVMTSDKFIYIFGRLIPALSLVFTMVLRLIPSYEKKTVQIAGARQCIGKSNKDNTKKEKVKNGMTILSVMTTWALEGALITADSMRSRGYGTGKPTSFSIYRFGWKEVALLAVMVLCFGGVIFAAAEGVTATEMIPAIRITGIDTLPGLIGILSYSLFMSIPILINLKETLIWQLSVKRHFANQ